MLGSWVLRGIGTCLLLGALGLGMSVTLAMVFVCAGAASAALPIAPGGAATQAGAGAGALAATGVTMHRAIEFALAAQILVILAGAGGAARLLGAAPGTSATASLSRPGAAVTIALTV